MVIQSGSFLSAPSKEQVGLTCLFSAVTIVFDRGIEAVGLVIVYIVRLNLYLFVHSLVILVSSYQVILNRNFGFFIARLFYFPFDIIHSLGQSACHMLNVSHHPVWF